MNAEVYTWQMVQASGEEHSDSVAAIKRSLAQAAAGELQDAEVFFAKLEQKYET
jgi:predicted transcriptional regulator